jgi:hypothetical protein
MGVENAKSIPPPVRSASVGILENEMVKWANRGSNRSRQTSILECISAFCEGYSRPPDRLPKGFTMNGANLIFGEKGSKMAFFSVLTSNPLSK